MKSIIVDVIGLINVVLIIFIMIHSDTNYVADFLAISISFGIFAFLFLSYFKKLSISNWIEIYAVSIVLLIFLIIKIINNSNRLVLSNEIWYPGVFFAFIVYQIREFICNKKTK